MEIWPDFLAGSLGREFLAGGLGGMAGVIAGHPLDTVRVRLQQPPSTSASSSASAVGLIRQIVSSEGPLALFKGMLSPLATIAVQNAATFVSSGLFRRALSDPASVEPLSYGRVYLAGFGAGSLQSLILTPVELIKIRVQVQTARRQRPSLADLRRRDPEGGAVRSVVRKVMRTEGWKGLYRGYGTTVLRDAPGYGFYFTTYEAVREVLSPGCRKHGNESVMTMLTAGGLAGVVSWFCVYPVDVVKSRLQANGVRNRKYSGALDCFRKSVQEEGYGFMWHGLGTTLVRAYIVNGAIFAAYELALRLMS